MDTLVLYDLYTNLCKNEEPGNEKTRAMARFVESLLRCWEPSEKCCPRWTQEMRDATSDCEFVTQALRAMNVKESQAFQSLTFENLEENMQKLRNAGVSDQDLLELNALVYENDEGYENKVKEIYAKVSKHTHLFALLELLTISRVPPAFPREMILPCLQPFEVAWINGELMKQNLSNAKPLSVNDAIGTGDIVTGNFRVLHIFQGQPMAGFTGQGFQTNGGILSFPADYNLPIGFFLNGDFIMVDLATGDATAQALDGVAMRTHISYFSAINPGTIQEGQVVVCLKGATAALDLENRQKFDQHDTAYIRELEKNVADFPGETNTIGTL